LKKKSIYIIAFRSRYGVTDKPSRKEGSCNSSWIIEPSRTYPKEDKVVSPQR